MQEAGTNPALARLEALVGEWEMQALIEGQPVGGDARTRFEWMEGGAFLVQQAEGGPDESAPAEWIENSPLPLTTIIGLDDASGSFCQLYADARGVFRVYQMSLEEGTWKVWRDAPGFFQRFTGTFSDDGTVITGRWETSPDGSSWDPDFDITYTKVS